jgi:acyl carrier protein
VDIVRQLMHETHPGTSHAVTLDTSFERDLALDSLARVARHSDLSCPLKR